MQSGSALRWVLAALLAASLLLGGASARGAGTLANGALQMLALAFLLYAVWIRRDVPLTAPARMLLWGLAALVGFVAISQIALPPSIWTDLPGREPVADGFALLGVELPSLPLSLGGRWTLFSILALLPPAAAFLLVAKATAKERLVVPWILLGFAVVSLILGAAQLAGGDNSPLRFYSITNPNRPVGFFANTNHLATLLLMAMPLATYVAARSGGNGRSGRRSGVLLAVVGGTAVLVGVALVNSVAGYALAVPVVLASALMFRRATPGKDLTFWKLGLVAVALSFVAFALLGPIANQAIGEEMRGDVPNRAAFAKLTWTAIQSTFPAGTGLGSFQEIYRTFESPALVDHAYVNHAHNDYLEVVLELGLFGTLLVLAFIAWYGWLASKAWRSDSSNADLARAASIIVAVGLLHSVVDYPLRTSAIAVVFTAACGLLTPPISPRGRAPKREIERTRHLVAE